jgi:gluconolactonase
MAKIGFIVRTLPVALIALAQPLAAQFQTIGGFERLTPEFDAIVPVTAQVEILATGFAWSEGPVWRKEGGYLLFSDAPNNVINKWTEADSISVFLRPAGWIWGPPEGRREHGSNGLIEDGEGRLLIADHGNRQIARLDETTWTKTTLAGNYQGDLLNSPNDMIVHSDGSIFFTDPPYGLQGGQNSPLKELDFSGVYRISPTGELTLLTRDHPFPNGIGLSPNERTLYVASTGQPGNIMAYDLQADGTIANGRIFFDPAVALGRPAGHDGFVVDQAGNLFASGPGGILVISPEGKHLGTIQTGRGSANAEFGEDVTTLFITSGPNLLRVRGLNTKGIGY